MLQSLSDGIKNARWLGWLIVGLIAVPFALWGIGSYIGGEGDAYVLDVNGTEISLRDYEREYNQTRNDWQRRFGGRLPAAFADGSMLKQQTIDNMISRELVLQAVAGGGYRVADETVRAAVLDIDQFRIEGQFSKDAYDRQLMSLGMSPAQFEEQVRRNVAVEQMRNGVVATAFYTPAELQSMEDLRRQTRDFMSIRFAVDQYWDSIVVSDEDVEAYFNERRDRYQTPEAVRLEYVELDAAKLASAVEVAESDLRATYDEQIERFSTDAQRFASHILLKFDSDADEAAVAARLEEAQALRERILAGEDFAALAEELSEDPGSAKQGGDLGLVTRGLMVAPFEEAVFALEEHQLSEPVKTVFGFHLIKLTRLVPGSAQTFEEVREQIERDLQQREAENLFYDRLDVLANESYEASDTLEPTATATGLALERSEWIEAGGGPGIGEYQPVRAAAFSSTVRDERLNSDVLELGNNHVVVVRFAELRKAAPQQLDEVSAEIRTQLIADRAREHANRIANEAADKVRAGAGAQVVADELDGEYAAHEGVGRRTESVDARLVGDLFRMPHPVGGTPRISVASDGTGNPVLLVLNAVSVAAEDAEGEADESGQAESMLGRNEYGAWLEAMRSAASIVRRDELL